MTGLRDVDAIVLAGGRASRLGGIDKTRLALDGTASSLDRVLAACEEAGVARRVVVGHPGGITAAARTVLVREDPPFGGPVAGLARGIRELGDRGVVLVLGGDLPHLGASTLRALMTGPTDAVRSVLDASGHVQYLCSAWPVPVLRESLAGLAGPDGSASGVSMKRLFGTLPGDEPVIVPADPRDLEDIDTPADLARARRRLAASANGPVGVPDPDPDPAPDPRSLP